MYGRQSCPSSAKSRVLGTTCSWCTNCRRSASCCRRPAHTSWSASQHHRNDVMGTVIGFHVDRLSLFDGTHVEEAFDFAVRDRRRAPAPGRAFRWPSRRRREVRQCTDDASPVWKSFDKDLSDTEAFESFYYCTSLPQLVPLPDPRRGSGSTPRPRGRRRPCCAYAPMHLLTIRVTSFT